MDPVTILGAVGSVVGIAGFGLQISQYLTTFLDDYNSANSSLNTIILVIESVNATLTAVESLLRKERQNVETSRKAALFSKQAIYNLKSMADECLRLFWKIEATILEKDSEKYLELRVERRLTDWNRMVACATENEPAPTLDFTLDDQLSKRQQFKWIFRIGAKLQKYVAQLDRQQHSLGTALQTVQLGALMKNP
jgi:hypothetical protein